MNGSATTPRPRRWLAAQATAILESVATRNYVRFGSRGVPIYLPVEAPPPPAHPAALDLALAVRSAQGTLRLDWPDLHLGSLAITEQQAAWSGYDPVRHVQVLWVWDFHRILSHVALRAELPGEAEAADDRWQDTLDAVRALEAGDVIVLAVAARGGDIHQEHTLANAAAEWTGS